MSDGKLDMVMYGDAAHVIREQAKLIKQQNESLEVYKKMGAESKKAGKESEKAAKEVEKAQAAATRELDKFARATKDINRTPLEKYADTMRQLETALKAGKIDQETFNRAVTGAKHEFDAAGKSREVAFGGAAIAQLKELTSGMFGLSAATQAFAASMERAQRIKTESMAGVDRLVNSRRELNQVGDNPADIQSLNDRADELAMKYGTDREQTRSMLFSARSIGFEGSADTIAKMAGANVLEMGAAARAAGKVPELFGGAISPEASLNAVLTAAKASDLNFEGVANALPTAVEGARPAGSTAAETIALLSVMAGRYKSGDVAAERLKSFGGFVASKDDLKGKGIVAAVEMLRGMPEEQRKEFFGENKDVLLGYDALVGELPTFAKRLPIVQRAIDEAGTPRSFLETRAREAFDPSTQEGQLNAARVEFNSEQTKLAVAREKRLAIGGYRGATAVARGTSRMEASPRMGPVQQLYGEQGMKYAETANAPGPVIEAMRFIGKTTGVGMIETPLMGIINGLQKLFGGSDKSQGSRTDEQHLDAARQLNAAANNLRDATSGVGTNFTNGARANQAATGGAVEAR